MIFKGLKTRSRELSKNIVQLDFHQQWKQSILSWFLPVVKQNALNSQYLLVFALYNRNCLKCMQCKAFPRMYSVDAGMVYKAHFSFLLKTRRDHDLARFQSFSQKPRLILLSHSSQLVITKPLKCAQKVFSQCRDGILGVFQRFGNNNQNSIEYRVQIGFDLKSSNLIKSCCFRYITQNLQICYFKLLITSKK